MAAETRTTDASDLRCPREDLTIKVPPVEVDIGELDHSLIVETRRVAPTAPRGQKRILAIKHPPVYRLRHGRWRGATWLETAVATQATDGRFVEERLRDVLFGLVLEAAEAELLEPRADWPSGELSWFEVARPGLREPPS